MLLARKQQTAHTRNNASPDFSTDITWQTAASFHGFTRLPIELQICILQHCIPTDRILTSRLLFRMYGPTVSKLYASKRLRTLVNEIYYTRITFNIRRCTLKDSGIKIFHFPHLTVGQHIRRLELRIRRPSYVSILTDLYHGAGFCDTSDLLILIRPHGLKEYRSRVCIPSK